MSVATIIYGESGTGKTASLRNLDPKTTLLFQAVRKPLPFKAAGWLPYDKATKTGSIVVTDNSATICTAMRALPHQVVIIDDWQYILANEFMRRSDERGFEKFTDIGRHAWDTLRTASALADNRRVYILAHSQSNELGQSHVKTIGKLLDEKITVEGMVTLCLRTMNVDGDYRFSTRNSGFDTVKTPMGMFEDPTIENDLNAVDTAICEYYGLAKS